MARRSKYTPELVDKLTTAVALGATHEIACAYAGIAESTFYDWQARKPEFSEAIREAEGRAAVGWLAKIERAANDGDWRAAGWKLERRYHDAYGRRTRLDVALAGEIHARAVRLAAELDLPVEEVERDLVLGVEAARP